jgi:RecA-family ATPase
VAEPSPQRFTLLSPDDLQALPEPGWLIKGVLPARAFCVLYGEPECGKTFVALSLALSIAAGHSWCGKTTAPGSVLYVAAEGLFGLRLRVRAYQQKHRLTPERIRYLGEAFNLLNPSDIQEVLLVLKAANFCPHLIVLDTLARLIVGADENSARDMGQAISGIDELRCRTSATVLVVHHTRKVGNSERGSSALRGAADVMISCGRDESGIISLT